MNTEVNIPLLRKVVEWAEVEAAKPLELSAWYQKNWAVPVTDFPFYDEKLGYYHKAPECGACFCIAGYTGQVAGITISKSGAFVDGQHVSDFARTALGLTGDQAETLFDAENTIEDVRRIAEEIAGERL